MHKKSVIYGQNRRDERMAPVLGIASPFPAYVRRDAMTIKLPD
jgi:hypothetical protein